MVGFGNTKACIKVKAFSREINYNDNPLVTKEVFSFVRGTESMIERN